MSKLGRRITNLELVRTPEMVFVTYLGNPEPMSLTMGGRRIERMQGESWGEFKFRIEALGPYDRICVGDFRRPT
jgi:hypothetical protein